VAAGARVKIGGCGHRGEYIKGERQAEKGLLARNARDLVALGRVRLGLKVEDDPDRWAPPVGDTEAWGRPVICCGEGRGGARRWLSSWAARRADWRWAGARRRKGEGGRQAAGEKKWAEPERRRGRGNAGRGGGKKGLGQAQVG
jgi:hypothetical protein